MAIFPSDASAFFSRAFRICLLAILYTLIHCSTSPEQLRMRPPGECMSRLEARDFKVGRNEEEGRICVLAARSSVLEAAEEASPTIFGPRRPVLGGLDLAAATGFRILEGRRFALLTNATGRDRELNSILDLLVSSGHRPELILEPEHGLYGADDTIHTGIFRVDSDTGIRVLSLYSQIKRPGPANLAGLDTLVVDLQNLPVRCYTYATTLTYILEDAEQAGLEVLILDRPHPYGIWPTAGGIVEEDYLSFVGTAPVPFLYSMTPGEYAIFMAQHRFHSLRLRVIRVHGFVPAEMDWVLAGSWINPSPNIPDLESALVYPGLVFFEGTNVSLGRGTTRPFVYSGAPWMKEKLVLEELRKLNLKGVRFGSVTFTPSASLYAGQHVRGIQFHPYSKEFDPLRTGYEYMRIIKRLHPAYFRIVGGRTFFMDRLWGSASYREAIEADLTYDEFRALWQDDSVAFEKLTASARIYGL